MVAQPVLNHRLSGAVLTMQRVVARTRVHRCPAQPSDKHCRLDGRREPCGGNKQNCGLIGFSDCDLNLLGVGYWLSIPFETLRGR